jgi:DNA topoisomerase-1
MKLLIVESPSKAKTIEKYLGGDFVVRASVGHVRDLPKSNKKAIDIEHGFKPHYEVDPKKQKVISELRTLSKKADELYLATDPDREGEAISWHIADTLKLKNPQRIVFHEITPEAVKEALRHPRKIDMPLKEAQEARRVLDRLVGYDLSGVIWKKVRYGLSAGRVQSPALRIIMEREREIRAFVPEIFYRLFAELKQDEKSTASFTFACTQEPKEQAEAERIEAAGKEHPWKVTDLKQSETNRAAKPPFTTSTLQQTASSRLGFAPSRTMRAAQKLYEKGFITYMRTDSLSLSESALKEIHSVIQKEFGNTFLTPTHYKTKSKNAQEAHEAIRPTHAAMVKAGATDDEKKLYNLIRSRTLASQMTPAKLLRTRVTANITGATIPDFTLNGSITLFAGWLAADPAGKGEDVELPTFTVGQALSLTNFTTEEKSTEPPNRYTEAGLVKELEKREIGRPSTYASILSTIEARGYVEKQGRTLYPTDTGDVVSSFLEANFPEYISDTFTAEMENNLDEIAEGKRTYKKTLEDFYKPFIKDVKQKEKEAGKATDLGDAPSDILCPECNSSMIIKLAKNGKFYSCSRYPDCLGARKIDGSIMEGPKETGEICPKCGTGKLVTREGRFGMFISCSNYPKCKFIKEDEENRVTTGVKCPMCNKGEMMERKGRFGIFYSCTEYPDCKNAIKAKPTGNLCSMCGALMMEGTKTIPERCSQKTCPNHRPDKLEK